MPWNGSGTFTRTNGVYTGSQLWQNTRDGGYNIRADQHDTQDQDIADGVQTCLAKDGQNTPTANLPMGGFRHTGVGAGAARTDYARLDQLQDGGATWGGTAGGTGNAITLTLTPAITAYAAGQTFVFLSSAANTGATTLNINSVGAANIRKGTGSTALVAGDIPTGTLVFVTYDGAQFILQRSILTGDSGSGGIAGLVPAPAAGDAAAGKYLKADGTWATAAGGGSAVSYQAYGG